VDICNLVLMDWIARNKCVFEEKIACQYMQLI
jgi:hypothetical protein